MKLLKETVENNHMQETSGDYEWRGMDAMKNQMHFDVCNKNESAMILM